jgi:hypothetical protein
MSERKAKKERRREAKRAEEALGSRKAVALLRRRRVTLIAVAFVLVALAVSVFNVNREPRLTLVNKTGATLREIRIEYAGDVKTFDLVTDGEKISTSLQPDAMPPADAPNKGLLVLQFRREDGPPFKLRSWAAANDPKLHQVFTAVSLPDGRINVIPLEEGGAAGIDFLGLLRRIGIRL